MLSFVTEYEERKYVENLKKVGIEVYRHQSICRLFVKIAPPGKLSGINLPSCKQILSAETQLFSWCGNADSDFGSWITNNKYKLLIKILHEVIKVPIEKNKNIHFLNLKDSTSKTSLQVKDHYVHCCLHMYIISQCFRPTVSKEKYMYMYGYVSCMCNCEKYIKKL